MAVSAAFKRMKERSDETLEYLRSRIRFDIGVQQKTKLKVLGDLANRTLLADAIAEKHGERLAEQFKRRWGSFTKNEMKSRLRFITVLAELVPLDLEMTSEAVEQMFRRLDFVFKSVKGIHVIGAAEIEIVNIEKMKAMASVADEARKLDVIVSLMPEEEKSLYKKGITSYALVHFHGIVDLGAKGEENRKAIEKSVKRYWNQNYALQIKGLYSTKAVKKNLEDIAAYLTKGGNENLIYKIGFGYDNAEKLERQMLKAGKTAKQGDYAGIENEMSLSVGEIEFLGKAINQMMERTGSKNLRNGYLYKCGQPQHWVR